MSTKTTTQGKKIVPPQEEARPWAVIVDFTYSDEFINTFTDTCWKALDDYLLYSHAPQEIRDLLDLTRSMQIEYSQVKDGKTPVRINESMGDLIGELSQLVARVGGQFTDHMGSTWRRENSILFNLEAPHYTS